MDNSSILEKDIDLEVGGDSQCRTVMATFRQWVKSGQLRPGQRIPAERALSRQLGVDRAVVRRSISYLIQEGLVMQASPRIRVVDVGLSRSRFMSGAVAVLCPAPELTDPGHAHPGWLEYISRGALEELRRRNQSVLTVHPKMFSEQEVQQLICEQPLGIVLPELSGGYELSKQLMRFAEEAAVPLVAYGEEPESLGVDHVSSDHQAGARQVTEWMIKQGRRRILPVFERRNDQLWVASRLRGYEEAMRAGGLEPLEALFVPTVPECMHSRQIFMDGVYQCAGALLSRMRDKNRPDALLAVSDRQAYTAAAACREFGLTPHQDVGIAGYDNYWEDCRYEQVLEPCGPQVTMDKRNPEVGRLLVDMLFDRVEGRLPDGPQSRIVPPELIVAPPHSRS